VTHPPVLSVSQVEEADSCMRRWWFERVRGFRSESSTGSEDGHAGHALLALHLTGGVLPTRARMLKHVRGALSRLPAPGPHLQVERRFSGQRHYDESGAFVPLDVSRTLWHAGHPWEGFIDLRFRHRDGTATVWDHKFSSGIHERALPAEKLIRTVQMPVYALDTLREWPDTRAFNLVHLYVSRRGVESFIRHQRVSVEQVRERAEELVPLVQQMDAVRAVTAQDDVPFNRAACNARSGCPHQFRCNAFRRNQMMDLTDEEKAMFGVLSDERPAGAPAPARSEEPLERPNAGRVSAPADLNLDDIFTDMPKPSTPKPQPAPTCEACGEVLTPENSSRLKSGDLKHIGCEKGGINLAGGGAITVEPVQSSAPKCSDCPHPTHAGKPCDGKRGRGKCQCGVAGEQPKPERVLADGTRTGPSGKPEHTADDLQAMADEAARAADVDGDGAAVEEARQLQAAANEARADPGPAPGTGIPLSAAEIEQGRRPDGIPSDKAEQTKLEEYAVELARTREARLASAQQRITELEEQLRTAREIIEDPELGPRGSWSGTLAVNVTVELGPATLAFLAGLVKR
jgi:hypothetical protein